LEFQSLKDELTRIANVTEYNGMNVLNGTYQEGSGRGQWRIQIGADNDINNQHEFSVMNATANGLDLNYTTYSDSYHSYNLAEFEAAVRDGNLTGKVYVDGSGEITFDDDTAGDVLSWDATANSDAGALVANSKVITGIGTDDSDPAVWLVSDAVEAVAADADAGIAEIQAADSTFSSAIDTSISNENRYESGAFDTTTYYYDANVGSVDAARSAVTHLDAAIDEINRERSYVGSEQNKLQFTMSNLSNNIQNIEASRSSIEDADFAAEAADLAKNQILAQSATAMLAQASAISQNVLGLLS
jgi:flagellin